MRLGTGGNRSARAVAILVACLLLLRAIGSVLSPGPSGGHAAAITAGALVTEACSVKKVAGDDSSDSQRHFCRDCAICVARAHAASFDAPSVLSVVASLTYRPPTRLARRMALPSVAASSGWTTSWSSRAPPSHS